MKFLDSRRLCCRMTSMTFGDNKEGDKFATFTIQAEVTSKDKNLPQSVVEGLAAMERNTTISKEAFDEKISSQNISFFSTPDQRRQTEGFTGIELEKLQAVRPSRGWPGENGKTPPKALLQFSFTQPFEYVTAQWAFRTYKSTFFIDLGECQQELPMDDKKAKPDKEEEAEE